MTWYITKLVVDSLWPGGGARFFCWLQGGGEAFFWCSQGGGEPFFCPPDVVFISDDHVINATSLRQPEMLSDKPGEIPIFQMSIQDWYFC